jgi:molecular chaperone DnaK (HSP70)
LEIHVFQGESPKASVNEFLGTLSITGLPPGRHEEKIALVFHLDSECLLRVSAKEPASGRIFEATIQAKKKGRARPGDETDRTPGGLLASDGRQSVPLLTGKGRGSWVSRILRREAQG